VTALGSTVRNLTVSGFRVVTGADPHRATTNAALCREES